MLKTNSYTKLVVLALGVLLPLFAAHWYNASDIVHAQGSAPTSSYTVYLPMVQAATKSTPLPTPVPPSGDVALFMQATQGKKVAGAHIKVDAQGGTHLAYYDAVPLDQNPGATYAYCPPPADQCSDGSKWSYLSGLGDKIDEVQLQLTRAGHPRLLLGYQDLSNNAELYIYGACDSNCTSEGGWAFLTVSQRSLGVINTGSVYQPKRSFALDAQDRPAFVLYDENYAPEPDHAGGYYDSCQSACTQPGSWTEARFTHRNDGYNEIIDQPVLQFTSAGKPRILTVLYPLSGAGNFGLYYIGCDTGCDSDANWTRTQIDERTSGPQPSWDLAFDAEDRARVTYFKYNGVNSDRNLFYLWCDTTCSTSGNWQSLNLGLATNEGIDADLELDTAGRPRIAYLTSTNLGYTWCNGNCTSAQSWLHGYADSDDQMTKDYPVPLPYTCAAGIWDSYAPSLALDPGGNPRMAYDASYQAYCQYQDPNGGPIQNEFVEVWHSVRTVFVPQP